MVVSIKDLENITANTLTIRESASNMATNVNIDMRVDSFDSLFQSVSDNFDKI